jgi:hypothetical protein
MEKALKILIAHNLVRLRKLPSYSRDRLRDAVYRLLVHFRPSTNVRLRPRDERLIVFISRQPRAREAKLAAELRRLGFRVVHIYHTEPNYNLRERVSAAHRVGGPWEALYRARQYSPLVYHLFTLSLDPFCPVILSNKPGRVIFDASDIIGGLINGYTAQEKTQRACLALADALCCKDVQVKEYERKCNSRLTRHKLWLPDLCEQAPVLWSTAKSDEIHVVNAGVLPDEVSAKAGTFPFIRAMAEAYIHVHLYPGFVWAEGGRMDWKPRYQEYFDLAKRTGYVHIHSPVPLSRLIDELRQYDFGLALHPIIEDVHEQEHYYSCGSSRLSDYLEAGLGIIANQDLKHIRFIARRYATVIDAELAFERGFRDILQRTREASHHRAQREFDFTTTAQAPRLVLFYSRVAGVEQASLALEATAH